MLRCSEARPQPATSSMMALLAIDDGGSLGNTRWQHMERPTEIIVEVTTYAFFRAKPLFFIKRDHAPWANYSSTHSNDVLAILHFSATIVAPYRLLVLCLFHA
jgi:hypothetical protein